MYFEKEPFSIFSSAPNYALCDNQELGHWEHPPQESSARSSPIDLGRVMAISFGINGIEAG
jgi:hypothetical protein